MVQFVRKLLAENQERAFVPLREKALRVRPHSFADLSFVDLYPRSFALFIPAEIEDCLCKLLQRPTIKVWTLHDCAVQGCCFLPASARDSGAQNAITRSLSSNAIPA